MEVKDKYIVFDTNMWLKIFSSDPKINMSMLTNLQKQNVFCMYNISLIEILMRFYRKNNLIKIKEILAYINKNLEEEKLIIGNISSPNFHIEEETIRSLLNSSDEEIKSIIEEFKRNRFEYKSSVITLWIVLLLQLHSPAFSNDKEEIDNIVRCFESKIKMIKDSFIEYFNKTENDKKKPKNLRDITNEVFKRVLSEVAKETNITDNANYVLIQNEINKLSTSESVSYIFKGVYKSQLMNIYKKRIDKILDYYYKSNIFKEIFYLRLEAFMQGECLQRNDVEDMLILSTLEMDEKIVLVTDDNKMRSYIKDEKYNLGNELHDLLVSKNQ